MEKTALYIGNMDRRIKIMKKVAVKGTTGAETFQDVLITDAWAERRTANSDKVLDDKVMALNIVLYSVHWFPGITLENIQALFIVDEGSEYSNYGYEFIGRKKYVKLKCQIRE